MILHFISKSPFENTAFEQCLKTASQQDAIVLISDGVLAVKHPKIGNIGDICLYAISDDLRARGITPKDNLIKMINFTDLVALTEKYPLNHTWF